MEQTKGLTDHTYVTVGDVHYGCWGGSKGGKVISKGTGKSKKASCMANYACIDGTAGIAYGISGVCHQTANRILKPADITVSKAKGYAASTLMYNKYGLGEPGWIARKMKCLKTWNPFKSSQLGEGGSEKALMEQVSRGELSLKDATSNLKFLELQDLINDVSDSQLILSDEKLNKIISLQDDLAIETESVVRGMRLMSSSDEFVQHKNNNLNALLKSLSTVLSDEEYESIFKFKVGQEIIVVDPEILANTLNERNQ